MPSSIVLSDNGASSGSAGIKTSGGNDGVLLLQTTTIGGTATTAVTIDTSQNMGLGVTPSAWGSTYKALDILYGGIAATTAGSANTEMTHNAYYNGTNWIAKYTGGYGTRYAAGDGGHAWHTSSTTTTGGSAITFTQAMTLDASGNLLLGATSNLSSAFRQNIEGGRLGVAAASDAFALYLRYNNSTNGFYIGSPSANALSFSSSGGTEFARIDSSGNLMVGATNSSSITAGGFFVEPNAQASGVPAVYIGSSSASSSYQGYSMYYTGAGAGYKFYVLWNGTINAVTTTITAISDQRLKENIRDLDDGLDVVMALKPRKFDWKEGKGADIKNARGFIAQEFEQVLPDMISEWQDPAPEGEEPYKAINANLIPTLVKAIQELKAELDTAKEQIAILQGAK